ncbi:MAG TPA: TonB family protein [Terriglobales bacterium]|nr:TonB family protein [Terriglobales bacterium]
MDALFGPASILSAPSPKASPDAEPKLLLELEPWGRTFLRNLQDAILFRRPPRVPVGSQSGEFWPDVFVRRPWPWASFFKSGLGHGLALAALLILGRVRAPRPQSAPGPRFDRSQVIYYTRSEYLPPLDTGQVVAKKATDRNGPTRKGEPEFAKQPILSVPPEADNHDQTIVTPPHIELKQSVPIPNMVAWGDDRVPMDLSGGAGPPLAPPDQVVGPPPEVAREERQVSSLAEAVVAPPPRASAVGERRSLPAPQLAVVVPPPAVDADASRPLGTVNLSAAVVAPAPKLAANAGRAAAMLNGLGLKALPVVPPSPEVEGMGRVGTGDPHRTPTQASLREPAAPVVPPPPTMQGADGRMIALGTQPAAVAPPEPPPGNRRGSFSASPEGKPGAPATPDVVADKNTSGHGTASQAGIDAGDVTGEAPRGLHVGAPRNGAARGGAPGSGSRNPPSAAEMASTRHGGGGPTLPKAVPYTSADPEAEPLAQQVFGERHIYAMTLNMPNLNSGGGSWVIRFAELNDDGNEGDLSAPVPQHKVDPAYPIELMRQNVGGTVALRAVIRADGSVGDVRLLRSIDDRLDRYAAEALSHWHFYPATRNGNPIDLEAVFMIPFKPVRHRNF